jgi:perosamine synthetase
VKHPTTNEGEMATTADPERDRRLRDHAIDTDFRQRESAGTWEYNAVELGFNFRLSDINAALGASQVRKVPSWVERRRELAARYRELLDDLPLTMLDEPDHVRASWHLFPIMLTDDAPDRAEVFTALRAAGIVVNVHYRPLHLHTTFRSSETPLGTFPVAKHAYARLLSQPMWHGLQDTEQEHVVELLGGVSS